MGASNAIAVAILLLGFILILTVSYSSVYSYQKLMQKAQNDQETIKKAKMQTDIAITNVSLSNNTGNVYLNITAINAGATTLNVSQLGIFVNGNYYSSYNLTPVNNYTWVPMRNINISLYPMNYTNTTGNRIKVVTGNGISAYALSP